MKRFFLLCFLSLSCFFINAQETCAISGFAYELEREGDDFFLIKITKPSDLTQKYDVFINGVRQEHPAIISDGPFYYGLYPVDCSQSYVLYIENVHNENCNITVNIGQVCALPDDCGFKEIDHEILSCDGVEMKMQLDFEPVHTGDLGFDLIAGNGDYLGFFLYADLPVTFAYPIGDAASGRLFISDNDNESCSATYEFLIDCEPTDECKIYDITFSYPECNPNGIIYVALDFEHKNVGETFTVKGNGTNYGIFSYTDLPIEVGPIAPECDKEYEFIIYDNENANCVGEIDGIHICCPGNCHEPRFEIVEIECTPDELFMKLELTSDLLSDEISITINNSIVQDFEINGNYIYLRYSNLFTSINNTISICYQFSDMLCCYSQNFSLDDCAPSDECKISDLEVSFSECDDTNLLYLKLDFKYQNTGDVFIVHGNGIAYGEFKYSELPVEIGPIQSQCSLPFEIAVKDAENPNCAGFLDNLSACCEPSCDEPSFEIIHIECDSEHIFIKAELKQNLQIDPLSVTINNLPVESYEIDFPYIYIRNANTTTAIVNTLEICNPTFTGVICCYSEDFTLENCVPGDECKIYGIEFSYPECSATGHVDITLDFKYKNVSSDSFIVKGNGNDYGLFSYEDLPINLGPFEANCDQEYEFVVSDFGNANCSDHVDGIVICCPDDCLEPGFEIISIECGNAQVKMKLELIQPLFNDHIKIYVNNMAIENYEVDLPYIYLEFPVLSPGTPNEITVCTNVGSMECCFSQSFSYEDCVPYEDCEIGDLQIETSDCTATTPPHFILDFDYSGVGEKGFSVFGNGHNYGEYHYEDLPISIQATLGCDVFYEFVVVDNENDGCSSVYEFGIFCCDNDCSFEPRDIRVRCNDGFMTEIGFFLSEETDPIKTYTVSVNGEEIGQVSENNVFHEFEVEIPIDPNQNYVLDVCDGECCVSRKLDVSDCEVVECSISNIHTSELGCGDAGLEFVLDFEHAGTSSEVFDVYSLFGHFGTFKYSELPVKISGFPRLGIGANILFVCDDDSFCCNAHIFNPPTCAPFAQESNDISYSEDDEKSYIFIKQNPVDQYLHLVSPEKDTNYRVFDADGNIVKEFQATDYETAKSVANLESGLYFIQIRTKKGIKTEKLIISK